MAYKTLFKETCIVFIKYFAVNWVFASKVSYKTEHIKFRFKLLRRVKNPKMFTYMKNSN